MIENLNKQERKQVPLYSGLIAYFPDALAAVSNLSYVGNKQHNGDAPMHWNRNVSTDHLDCLMRHLLQAGEFDDDDILHDVKIAWRALAHLQLKLESL